MGDEIKLAIAAFTLGFITAKWPMAALWGELTIVGWIVAFVVVWNLHEFIERK